MSREEACGHESIITLHNPVNMDCWLGKHNWYNSLGMDWIVWSWL